MTKEERDLSVRLKTRYPDFDKGWKRLVKDLGSGLVTELKRILGAELGFIKEITNFRLKLIVDNNFVLGQLLTVIRKNDSLESCFLSKILQTSVVSVYAPPKLRNELSEKIDTVLQEKKDRELAHKYAETLLSKIEIKDAQWIDSWKKAHNLIGGVDEDDVPYLALALEVGGHAIMSFDNVFLKQGDVKVWKHADTDRIITKYNSGFISICILGQVSKLLGKLLSAIFKIIRDLIVKAIKFIVKIVHTTLTQISKVPIGVWIIVVSMGIIFWDEIKQGGKDLLEKVRLNAKLIFERIKKLLHEIQAVIRSILDFVDPVLAPAFEFMGFLYVEYLRLSEEIAAIKLSKAA